MDKPLAPDELELICTVDGIRWWQRRREAKTHTAALYRSTQALLAVMPGDIVVKVVNDEMVGQRVISCGNETFLGKPFIMEIVTKTSDGSGRGRLVERDIETGRIKY